MSFTKFKRELNDLIKGNMIHRFVAHLQNTKDPVESKKIRDILHRLQTSTSDTPSSGENKLQEYLRKIDTYQYKKQWFRLKPFQRKNQLVKFIEDKKLSKDIQTRLLSMLDEGMLNSKSNVEYDSTKGKIISIKYLHYDEETDEYTIVLPKKKGKSKSKSKSAGSTVKKTTKKPTKKTTKKTSKR